MARYRIDLGEDGHMDVQFDRDHHPAEEEIDAFREPARLAFERMSHPEIGDRVRVASGDYEGKHGCYAGREEATDVHKVWLDGDHPDDTPVHCDEIHWLGVPPRG